MGNAINWFEIPAEDFSRAIKFYSEVLQVEMPVQKMMGIEMAFFPMDPGDRSVGGAVVYGEEYQPGRNGVLIYLNGGEDLDDPLSRVEKAGGKIVTPKTLINEEIGYFAIFWDSEGNRVALHSYK